MSRRRSISLGTYFIVSVIRCIPNDTSLKEKERQFYPMMFGYITQIHARAFNKNDYTRPTHLLSRHTVTQLTKRVLIGLAIILNIIILNIVFKGLGS